MFPRYNTDMVKQLSRTMVHTFASDSYLIDELYSMTPTLDIETQSDAITVKVMEAVDPGREYRQSY